MAFHLTDAKRMLAIVDRITAAGNRVRFGPQEADNYIEQLSSCRRIKMRKENGVYLIDVFFIHKYGSRTRGQIVVDSGAAENVMPREMLPDLDRLEPKRGITCSAANGGAMGNYGRAIVGFVPCEDSTSYASSGFTRRA